MLYKFHLNIFIVSLLTFGFITALAYTKSVSVMTLSSLVALTTQLALMVYFSRDDEESYSERTLFYTVLIYTFFLGIFFMLISEFYDGDNFLFSKKDAMYYYRLSSQAASKGLSKGIKFIVDGYTFEDWGALIFDTFVLYLIPSKLFLNVIYTVLGAISSVLLYRIGKPFMPDNFAYLAALAYSTSSYIVFFNCSFLKESLFVFVVICAFYYLYCAISYHSNQSLISAAVCIGLLFFFRPAVAAMIAASIFCYYGITQKGNAISLFLYGAAVVVLLASLKTAQEMFDNNTSGGNMDAVIADTSNQAYSGGFNYFVSFFGAFFGPFPTLLPKVSGPSSLEYQGAGLAYKLFLVFPFWYGIYSVLKNKLLELTPIVLFILMEMLLTAAVCASLELRKVLLHVPFMYIIAFYGVHKGFSPHQVTRLTSIICYAFFIAVLLLWNVLKAENVQDT